MISALLVSLIAALHLYILVLDMALWETPRARRAFGTTPEFAKATKVLAANQGLYNGFLAAGLIWSLRLSVAGAGQPWAVFFLICIAAAGIFGAATASRRILFIQTVPAALALMAIFVGI